MIDDDKIWEFWSWFSFRQIDFRLLYTMDAQLANQLRGELHSQLKEYCPFLSAGLGGTREAPNQLLITANGNKDYFPHVEELIENAPKIEGWNFTPFKPPLNYNFTIRLDQLTVSTEDLWFKPLARIDDPAFFGIKVFYKYYETTENKATLQQLLYEMLPLMCGEKMFALDINYVDFGQLPVELEDGQLEPLVKINEFVEWHKSLTKKQTHLN